ncbi:AI-2E family transporter [Microbacterium sp. ASV49]|uniref:AI-2E family transporter n=1 Tax=Microbacterium candidum TaxID=3041922 RepID=A0ABT7MUH2_9MICO|nr:AI-2E family transporter [Microbacterium sp. ASV49]MDL9978099.1 AI-2E family transporter [Microbacterium sp. ASV49]
MTDDTRAGGAVDSIPTATAAASAEAPAPAEAPTEVVETPDAAPTALIESTDGAAAARGDSGSKPLWAALSNPFAVGLSLTLGGLVAFALGTAFVNLSTIIIYVVFALFAALGLDPVVRMFERHKVSRAWGIVIVYSVFALVMTGVLLLVIPALVTQITKFFADLPQTIADFEKTPFYAWLVSTFGSQVPQIVDQVQKFLTNPANLAKIGGGVLNFAVTVGTTISGLIIVIVLSLYFLATLPTIKQSLTMLAPARNRAKTTDLTNHITDSIGGYLMGMVILAFCNSIVAFFLHLFLGLPFPGVMALLAFLITLIPLIGSVLYWLTATVIALFTGGWVPALIFAVIYLVYIQIEAYVLTPRVMNKTISVPGSLVVIGALVGGTLFGLLGALVAIPITASILLIIKQIVIPRQDAKR